MKALFRSEKMQHCEMILHAESAFECLIQLGYLGAVQFINESSKADEPRSRYQPEIQRCNEMLRLANQMEHESHLAGMKNFYYPEVDLEDVPQINDMKEIEAKIHRLNEDLLEIDRNTTGLKRREMALKEEYYVLNHVQDMLKGQHNTERIMAWSDSIIMNLIKDETSTFSHEVRAAEQKLRFYAGTIPVERFASFETMLYRLCYHNFYIHKENIPEAIEDAQGTPIRKYALMLVFVGEKVAQLINKVCQGFRVRSVPVSESSAERSAQMENIQTDLKNFKQIYDGTSFERNQILAVAGADLFVWKIKLLKMLAIYTELNEMSEVEGLDSQKYLKASCWVPAKDIKRVRKALLRGARRAARGDMSMMFPPSLAERSNRAVNAQPPTSISLNKFTRAFQKLIDAYGLPKYQELNPAPYTVITFPFLFAVMFGDMGHGLIMFLFAAWLVKNEVQFEEDKKKTKKSNEIWDILFAGRYIILLMGLFSMYTGLIYNDIFSLSINFFGSSWKISRQKAEQMLIEAGERHALAGADDTIVLLNPASKTEYSGTPYILGMDPIWNLAQNNIQYANSYKMKLSIILGVIHMVFGLVLFAFNCAYFRNAMDFYFVFIPQLTFLVCIFGYLVLLIIYKWWAFGGHYAAPNNTACAPSVLLTFINMLLFKNIPKAQRACEDEIFSGQGILQYFFLFMAVFSIPILLAGKPLHLMRQRRKIRKARDEKTRLGLRQEAAMALRSSLLIVDDEDSLIREPDVENIDLTELWIHSGIQTIECVLGAISHTASYLRLWALSLAHEQLSLVLWDFLMKTFFKNSRGVISAVGVILAFYPWASLTIAIMIVMEGLSAFLHCLRLHWVEFQSKFYAGNGLAFRPFLFPHATDVELL